MSVASDNYNAKGIHYVHIERYDSIGRICPDYTIPATDTTILQKGTSIYRGTFNIIKTPAMLITNSDLFSTPLQNYNTLFCSGVPPYHSAIKNDLVTAKSSKQTLSIQIFPNPAKDYLKLKFSNDKSTLVQIQIISADGKIVKVFTSFFDSGNATKSYDISYLPKGIYLLKTTTSATKQTNKFIKE